MRKLFAATAVLLAAIMTSGCAALLNSIATNPTFVVPGNIVYNGQTVRLSKSGTCNYKWECDNPANLILTEKDGQAYVTGQLEKDKYGTVSTRVATIKAYNADDETVKPVEVQVDIRRWALMIYDAAGNMVDQLSLAKNTEYTAKMVLMGGASGSRTYHPVEKVYSSMKIGAEEFMSMTFSVNVKSVVKVSQTELTYTFKTPAKATPFEITAKLGAASEFIRCNMK